MKKMVNTALRIYFTTALMFLGVGFGFCQNDEPVNEEFQVILERLEQNGPSLEIFFNLGNAYLKNDSIAAAIFYYEHALRIDPVNTEVINNLNIARSRIEDPLIEIPDFFLFSFWNQIRNQLSPNGWAFLSIVFLGLICGILYWVNYKDGKLSRRHQVILYMIFGFMTLTTTILSIDAKNKITSQKEAIVFHKVKMKSGPDIRSGDIKQLYPGHKLSILDEIEGWKKVRTIDREEGWVLPDWIRIINI